MLLLNKTIKQLNQFAKKKKEKKSKSLGLLLTIFFTIFYLFWQNIFLKELFLLHTSSYEA